MAACAALCLGLLPGWKREVAGGTPALTASPPSMRSSWRRIARPPRGRAWPLLGLPGLLYLACAYLERLARGRGAA